MDVDGERYPNELVRVETHPGLATFIVGDSSKVPIKPLSEYMERFHARVATMGTVQTASAYAAASKVPAAEPAAAAAAAEPAAAAAAAEAAAAPPAAKEESTEISAAAAAAAPPADSKPEDPADNSSTV